ncbi:uncharacterized protein LOC131233824 [Magnolia sinica]|uniref:uncharacterized protein LOC131233824 n=1 Tax=Magnolia sinica TaxID=86752 RepID=UPI0026587DAF|nr:uncharacterized protein LOC131233824 [Magnolia sinica]
MASDLFLFDGSFLRHCQDPYSADTELQFLSDPLFHFPDPLDNLQSFSTEPIQPQLSDPFPIPLPISTSPPSHKIQNLSLGPTTTAQGITDLGVKLEEFCMDFEQDYHSLPPNNLGLIQRSFSSHSLDRKPTLLFQPHFSSLSETPKFETQISNSIENHKFEGSMRRACSTGDLQRMNSMQSNSAFPSPLATETSYVEEVGSFRVGRYSAEERKQRINRYRNKRNQRNFNKTIKYACRKTLADSRPRVRGRFARNDETGETTKAPGSHREEEDEEEQWVDGLNDGEEELVAIRDFVNSNGPIFQYWDC